MSANELGRTQGETVKNTALDINVLVMNDREERKEMQRWKGQMRENAKKAIPYVLYVLPIRPKGIKNVASQGVRGGDELDAVETAVNKELSIIGCRLRADREVLQ